MKEIIVSTLDNMKGENKIMLSYIKKTYNKNIYPASYLEFIKKHNGGLAGWYYLDIPYEYSGKSLVNKVSPLFFLFSLDDYYNDKNSYSHDKLIDGSILWHIVNVIDSPYRDELSKEKYIPISSGVNSSFVLFCLTDLNDKGEPSIYFQDISGFSGLEEPIKIADSFDEFIDSLTLDCEYLSELDDEFYEKNKHILTEKEIIKIDKLREE